MKEMKFKWRLRKSSTSSEISQRVNLNLNVVSGNMRSERGLKLGDGNCTGWGVSGVTAGSALGRRRSALLVFQRSLTHLMSRGGWCQVDPNDGWEVSFNELLELFNNISHLF
jgi:hypothetical protein